MRTQHNITTQGWQPPFEEVQDLAHINRKIQRSFKLAQDMRDKVRARRAEDQHIMELAEYYQPFMEA